MPNVTGIALLITGDVITQTRIQAIQNAGSLVQVAADAAALAALTPTEGYLAYQADTDVIYAGDGTAWVAQGKASELTTHAALTNPHSATDAATASRLVLRDASGRAKFAAPSASTDAAIKDTVDTHAALQTAHGAVSAATASKIVVRDASGRAQFASPSAAADAAIKSYVDAHQLDKLYRIGHTYAIPGEIKVPSGDTDFVVPFFVSLATGQTAQLVKARYKINSGTSVTAKLTKNGVDITGFTSISVTTTAAETDPADVALADNDLLALVVTAVSATPKNLSFALFIEYTQ